MLTGAFCLVVDLLRLEQTASRKIDIELEQGCWSLIWRGGERHVQRQRRPLVFTKDGP
jgi:hypothetical protein